MNEQELNKKLAEWAGFSWGMDKQWVHTRPDGIIDWVGDELPNFTQSLDACFEWLVPKLIQTFPIDAIGMEQGLWSIHLHNTAESETKIYYDNGSTKGISTAHSLCLAIEKLMEVHNG